MISEIHTLQDVHSKSETAGTLYHLTTGDVCSVLQMVDDRDEISDVNFGLSALKSIQGARWPLHLCSSCSETI